MKKFFFILLLGLYFAVPKTALAITDPLAVDNNKYGIHIADENDLVNAAALVNSSGGDWGYVTIVIREDDRHVEKWQKILDKMREFHLIPLVRLATSLDGDTWKKPRFEDISSWADFLSTLNWVIDNRYVIVFNEPNHAKEWGGDINPKEYAEIISSFSAILKNRSSNFFILPAGFDASAPNGPMTRDEKSYLQEMISYKPEILTSIDGWTSHSYPNPAFTGRVNDLGRGTLRTYKWEAKILQSLGLKRNLPVFITETGWPHQEGLTFNRSFFTAAQVAEAIESAAHVVWSDENIVAVTPFLLNYQDFPFANFSWQMPALPEDRPSSPNFYPQFDSYRSLPKIAGKPVQQILTTPTPNSVLGETVHSQQTAQASSKTSILQKMRTFIVYLQKLVYNLK